MGHTHVDERTCRRDGICVAVCPLQILELAGGDGFPVGVAGAEERCIACGHCVAACPHGAMSLAGMASGDCPPVRPEWRLGPEQAEHFLRSRRSIRTYKDAVPAAGAVERLIRVASHAPSHNRRPLVWTVVSGRDAVRGLGAHTADWMRHSLERRPELARQMQLDRVVGEFDAGRDVITRGAPALVAAHAPRGDVIAPSSATIALAWLELAAPSFGLGACWAGYVHMAALSWQPLQAALGIPEGRVATGAMMLGEPKYRYHRLPLRPDPVIEWR